MMSSTRLSAALCAALCIGGALGLSACGPTTVREYNAARWIVPDTSLVYLFHHFQVGAEGGSIGRPERNNYPYSRVTLFRIRVGEETLVDRVELHHDPEAVPCGELEYRPDDSLLFYSYLVPDGYNGISRHSCGPDDTNKRLALGKLDGDRWIPAIDSVDTASYFAALTLGLEQPEDGLVIDSVYERMCAAGRCIRTSDP